MIKCQRELLPEPCVCSRIMSFGLLSCPLYRSSQIGGVGHCHNSLHYHSNEPLQLQISFPCLDSQRHCRQIVVNFFSFVNLIEKLLRFLSTLYNVRKAEIMLHKRNK